MLLKFQILGLINTHMRYQNDVRRITPSLKCAKWTSVEWKMLSLVLTSRETACCFLLISARACSAVAAAAAAAPAVHCTVPLRRRRAPHTPYLRVFFSFQNKFDFSRFETESLAVQRHPGRTSATTIPSSVQGKPLSPKPIGLSLKDLKWRR